MKRFICLAIIFVFLFSVSAIASENMPLKKIGTGLDNIVYGSVETPDCINETNTKGQPAFEKCTTKTNDGVGRSIVRVVGGLWQIATFWYPEDSK